MPVEIAIEDPDQPEVRALLAKADAYYAVLYPAESNHLLDVTELRRPEVAFFVARREGAVVGFGCLVRQDGDYGEIKRLYVIDAARGAGAGRAVLDCIERHAASLGLRFLRLETGIRQPEALSLYRAAGFRERPPFGAYQNDPLSLFMEKRLAPRPRAKDVSRYRG
ncbi:MAG TPA: GNAT family N-acetyltransferase [Stellaceae bacterium]|nr:GNAT family N-acetyltransferase [Stellaceae bacterium]